MLVVNGFRFWLSKSLGPLWAATVLMVVLLLTMPGIARAQEEATLPAEIPEAALTAAAETPQETPSATPTEAPTSTPTDTATPTPSFPSFSVQLTIDPQTTTGNYNPGDDITFSLRVINLGGGTLTNRSVVIRLVYDAEVFRAPLEANISPAGTAEASSISWVLSQFPEGEDHAEVFTFKTTLRADIRENTEAKATGVVSTSFNVELARSDLVTIPVVSAAAAPAAATSVQVPQGEGLFKNEGSFAVLIGIAFVLGSVAIVVLSGMVIYRTKDDDAREQTFRGTTEVLLLLVVVFSVIIMGVQNAIDRESINAIMGGIVGYVAGRVNQRISLPRDLLERLRGESGDTTPPSMPDD